MSRARKWLLRKIFIVCHRPEEYRVIVVKAIMFASLDIPVISCWSNKHVLSLRCVPLLCFTQSGTWNQRRSRHVGKLLRPPSCSRCHQTHTERYNEAWHSHRSAMLWSLAVSFTPGRSHFEAGLSVRFNLLRSHHQASHRFSHRGRSSTWWTQELLISVSTSQTLHKFCKICPYRDNLKFNCV